MFNVLERKFVLFSIVFPSQDFHLFIFNADPTRIHHLVYGGLWAIFCGWVCPQTIFMEMVYRRIEYFIEGDLECPEKNSMKLHGQQKSCWKNHQTIFFLPLLFYFQYILSYIIGYEEVWRIATEPISMHTGLHRNDRFSFLFYGVFAFMQGAGMHYYLSLWQITRRDPRSQFHRHFLRLAARRTRVKSKRGRNWQYQSRGDCVGTCIKVCPTGIDIEMVPSLNVSTAPPLMCAMKWW